MALAEKAKNAGDVDVPIWRNHCDEGLTPTKDGGRCLRRLSMLRKEVH